MTMNYTVKLHTNELMSFKYDDNRPIVKHIFEDTYIVPKECVIEQVEELLDVPYNRIESPKDLSEDLRRCLSEKEEKEFIEKNNKLFDFWKRTKPQIEEWMVLFSSRKEANFKHFTIDLDKLNWCNHSWDTQEDEDKAYIDIASI